MDPETSGCGLVGTVVRELWRLLVIIVNWFWLLIFLHKEQFDLVLWLVLLFNKPNRTGFCPFYWFCSSFAHQPWKNQKSSRDAVLLFILKKWKFLGGQKSGTWSLEFLRRWINFWKNFHLEAQWGAERLVQNFE